jgi:A/G-specific adenine glycosylase
MKRVVPAPAAGDGRQFADATFSATVIAWQKQHGRHALPWQNTRDAYRIWLSEIMLQQTQVSAVIPYYLRFLQRFPDVASLAAAPVEDVMAHWSGLGYYTRARNLHRCAQQVVAAHGGIFPADPAMLADLPGIGRSTAAAIAAFAYGARAAILDGNVKRVFARVFGVDGYPGEKKVEDALWLRAEALLPPADMTAYTQGLMDLGATVCARSRPACPACPLATRCVAFNTLRTAELPVRKPKKAVPQKHAALLVILHEGHVLLQQRPETGIWGGLLSLPEVGGFTPLESNADALPALADQALLQAAAPYGVAEGSERLPTIVHVFTHFKLHITPYRVHLARRLPMAAQDGHVWLAAAQLAHAPLPAPVKKLLLGIA